MSTLNLVVGQIPEPLLEFGGNRHEEDPKIGLREQGPVSAKFTARPVQLGLVGPEAMLRLASDWFSRMNGRIPSQKQNRRRFPDFPGFDRVFGSPVDMSSHWAIALDPLELARALAAPQPGRLEAVVRIYAEAVSRLAGQQLGPNVIVTVLPDEVLRECATSGPPLRRRPAWERFQLPLAFDADNPPLGAEEALAYRTFRRALKARVMAMNPPKPVQIATNHLFVDVPGGDDMAAKAWSLSVGLFYKAGGVPWRVAGLQAEICFAGISFHKLRTTFREAVYSSSAQAYSSEHEAFVLRGAEAALTEDLAKSPYLRERDAASLGDEILRAYRARADRPPTRVTLHKTTAFQPSEVRGFTESIAPYAALELVSLGPTAVRLLPSGAYPPRRGTTVSINDEIHLLYTSGYVHSWETYPGPHIPEPLRIGAPTRDNVRRIQEETLGLTKMNFNAAVLGGREPITLLMASRVGPIMAEVRPGDAWQTDYRFYM